MTNAALLPSPFEFSSYKPFLEHRLAGQGQRGQLSRAAEALGCQRSYLSRVISEGMQLTPDHAFKLARFFKLTSEEREYFQTMVEHERAGDPDYRGHLKQKLAEMKKKHESIPERTARAPYSVDAFQVGYFSTWIWSAVHFLTSIPEYQTLEALASRLGLRAESLLPYLEELAAQGFIERKGSRWLFKSGEFHAPKNSPLVLLHHQNWRGRAVLDAQDFTSTNLHYTGVHTVSRADHERLKSILLDCLAEFNRISGPSEPEEGVVFTFDYFKI